MLTRFWPLLLAILALYLAYLALLYSNQTEVIYPGAFTPAGRDAPQIPAGVQQVWIEPEPGIRVEAWYLLGRGRSAQQPGPAVLIAHGNFERIEQGLYHARHYADLGISTLLVEYRGYGRSGGTPSQAAITRDCVAFRAGLAARPEVDPQKIVYHGRSLGGAAVAQLAALQPPAALILESTFSNSASMALRRFAPPFLVHDQWATDAALQGLNRPILILHGRQDPVIPIAEGRRLHAALPVSEMIEYDGGHADFPRRDEAGYWQAIQRFLTRAAVLH